MYTIFKSSGVKIKGPNQTITPQPINYRYLKSTMYRSMTKINNGKLVNFEPGPLFLSATSTLEASTRGEIRLRNNVLGANAHL